MFDVKVKAIARDLDILHVDYAVMHLNPHKDLWCITCNRGPTWYWNFEFKRWVISIGLDTDNPQYWADKTIALNALQTIDTKKKEYEK